MAVTRPRREASTRNGLVGEGHLGGHVAARPRPGPETGRPARRLAPGAGPRKRPPDPVGDGQVLEPKVRGTITSLVGRLVGGPHLDVALAPPDGLGAVRPPTADTPRPAPSRPRLNAAPAVGETADEDGVVARKVTTPRQTSVASLAGLAYRRPVALGRPVPTGATAVPAAGLGRQAPVRGPVRPVAGLARHVAREADRLPEATPTATPNGDGGLDDPDADMGEEAVVGEKETLVVTAHRPGRGPSLVPGDKARPSDGPATPSATSVAAVAVSHHVAVARPGRPLAGRVAATAPDPRDGDTEGQGEAAFAGTAAACTARLP